MCFDQFCCLAWTKKTSSLFAAFVLAMVSTGEKNILAMEVYAEVEVKSDLSMDEVKVSSKSLKWLEVEDSAPHLCLRHWLVEKANKTAWSSDVIVWESLYYVVKEVNILDDEASVLVADIYDQNSKLVLFRK